MKKITILSTPILLIGICLMILSPTYANNDRLPDPKIQAGIAKVTGKVINYHQKEGEENKTLILCVPNPVTAEMGVFKTLLSEDGSFQFEVPVECSINIGTMGCLELFNDNGVSFGLIPGEVTKLEISFDAPDNLKVKVVSSLGLTSDDLPSYSKMFFRFQESRDNLSLYTMTPEDFSHYAIEKLMVQRLKRSINDSIISEKGKTLITNQCKLKYLKGCLLTYSDYVSSNYRNHKPKGEPDNFTPQEPNRSYYTFLKDFNLSNPQYLYNDQYTEVLQTLLSNKTLNIPAIKDTPVNVWLKDVKKTMADLIGSDTGLFYDMLVANAYAKQFIDEQEPLSEKQKENIRSYFKNKEITNILLKRNEEIIKQEKEKNYFKTIINATPAVPKKALMDAIISKYKGKAVLVDFWATWCQPCMAAMKETREVKSAMKDKGIVFVYITGASSPKASWEEKIKIIGGEHYYLTQEEWESVMDSFGFNSIPTYLFFDKNGILKNKVIGYPGKEKMQKMIEELLL